MKMINNFRFNSIRFKIFTFIIILIILPIAVISFVIYFSSTSVIGRYIDRYENTTINLVQKNIQLRMDQIYYTAAYINMNAEVQEALKTMKSENEDNIHANFRLNDSLKNAMYSNDYITSIYVSALGGKSYYVGDMTMQDENKLSAFIKGSFTGMKRSWYFFPQQERILSDPFDSISFVKSFDDYMNGGKTIGVIAINIKTALFQHIIDDNELNGHFLILDDRSRVIYSASPRGYQIPFEDLNLVFPEKSGYVLQTINKNQYSLTYDSIRDTDWKLVIIRPVKHYLEDVYTIRNTIVATGIICFVLFLVLGIRLSKQISDPLIDLAAKMKKVENGELTVRTKLVRKDEIGQIQRIFNRMVVRIRTLLQQVYEEEEKKRNAELLALQAQINPHFIYNTLNSIYCIAKIHQMDQIGNITVGLSDLMRIAFNDTEKFITLEQEIDYIEKYVMLQNIRYKDKFTLRIMVDPQFLQVKLPKLILQPLVENCIYHGFEEIESDCNIDIHAAADSGYLLLEVSDNGIGLTEDQIEQLNRSLQSGNPQPEQVGIINVHERISLHYGSNAGLKYRRNPAGGVSVEIRIPYPFAEVADEYIAVSG